MTIERLAGGARGRSRAVVHEGRVYTVATAADTTLDIAGQTAQTLAVIDRNLTDCGSNRTRILSATVYLVDITRKSEMDSVWNDWIGPDNWPQRACVGAALHGDTVVEITIVAAR